jgi:hypothetical protein
MSSANEIILDCAMVAREFLAVISGDAQQTFVPFLITPTVFRALFRIQIRFRALLASIRQ